MILQVVCKSEQFGGCIQKWTICILSIILWNNLNEREINIYTMKKIESDPIIYHRVINITKNKQAILSRKTRNLHGVVDVVGSQSPERETKSPI